MLYSLNDAALCQGCLNNLQPSKLIEFRSLQIFPCRDVRHGFLFAKLLREIAIFAEDGSEVIVIDCSVGQK